MPPKRKVPEVPETEENNIDDEKRPAKKDIKTSSRMLRPRLPVAPAEPTKTIKTKLGKTARKEVKDVESTAKAKRGNKKKAAQSDDGEPAEKQGKLNIIVTEKDDNELIDATSVYDFTAKDINGQLISLDKYKGHVCIIVNVASKCGHTSSNYKEFVEIYDKFNEDKGLKILAFPCNQFGKQEPGDNEKICEFAKKRNVNFDMFEKIEVNGKNAHPLWKFLASQKEGPKGSRIEWNFTKFLINKKGQVVERFKPGIKPSALVKELDNLW